MDDNKRSAHLLQVIANYLNVPVEHFTQDIAMPENDADIELISAHQDVSIQAQHLIRLYCSLPDQPSKDLAVKMVERFAKYQDN